MLGSKSKIVLIILGLFLFLIIMFLLNFLSSKKYSFNDREYLLHLPSSSSKKMPLVIALHGYKDNPRLMEFYTGLSRKADKEKFIVVYPYGTKSKDDKYLSWNGGSCCGNGVVNNVDDINFINNVTDELIKSQNVDPDKIFVVGFSNGALLAYRIASETPERYKSIAIVSGSIGGKVYKKLPPYLIPTPKKPISILILHGMKDGRIPYLGGENANKDGFFNSFKEASDFWMKANSCSEAKTEEDEIVKIQKFDKCKEKMELYTVKNAGHVWSGSILDYKNVLKRKSYHATDAIWDFFKSEE